METAYSPQILARAYFDHWRAGRFGAATEMIAEDVTIETPVNRYPGKPDFVAALKAFGGLVEHAELLAEHGDGDSAVLIYDMEVRGLGLLRIAEHLEFRAGQIVVLRQIHDTIALRQAGFVRTET